MTVTDDRELHALMEEIARLRQALSEYDREKKPYPLMGDIKGLRYALYVANENGFLCNNPKEFEQIVGLLSNASKYLRVEENEEKAAEEYSKAEFCFNLAMNQKTSFEWRLIYQHGAGILAYLVLVLAGIFMAWFLRSPDLLDLEILWVPSWAFLWGAMGGVLQGFWNLWHFVAYSGLRKLEFIRFFSLPLMGSILGALTYLIFFAGFIAVTGEAQAESESFIMLLCALAGFSSKWAVDILNNITDMIKVGAEKTGAL
jgi:hypothetical protein